MSQIGKRTLTAHTLQETADMLGITRERVRQIETRAFAKIRKVLRQYGYASLQDFLNA